MMRVLIFCLLGNSVVFAQTQSIYHYAGHIGKYPVVLRLSVSDTDVSGWYKYVRYREPILIRGTKNAFGNNGERFSMTWSSDSLKGTWNSNGRSLPVALHLISAPRSAYTYKYIIDLQSLHVLDDHNNVVQQIDVSVGEQVPVSIILEDLNFDGHADIKIPVDWGEGGANVYYLCWVFSPERKQFEERKEISDRSNVEADPFGKQVISAGRLSAHRYFEDRFICQDDHFFLIERRETDLAPEDALHEREVIIKRYRISGRQTVLMSEEKSVVPARDR